jgi:hypothetical protein
MMNWLMFEPFVGLCYYYFKKEIVVLFSCSNWELLKRKRDQAYEWSDLRGLCVLLGHETWSPWFHTFDGTASVYHK